MIVGNETLLLGDMGVEQLIGYLDRARAQMRKSGVDGRAVDIWQQVSGARRHVDFVTVHILPYWEGEPRKDAIGLDVLQAL